MSDPIVTLTTDFGTRDGYVGAMKGVVLGICPEARIVDITHEIAPQDIFGAATALRAAVPHFPQGSVHVAVVDPGVGGARRAIACGSPAWRLVGPDNGVFDPLWQDARERFAVGELQAVELAAARFFLAKVSATFHGRDVFAPVAAHVARGTPLHEFGPTVESLLPLPLPEPVRRGADRLEGQVIHLDRFGNCITNIKVELLDRLGGRDRLRVSAAGLEFGPVRRAYGDVAPGTALALVDSAGRLELSLSRGDLAAERGIGVGATVRVERG